MAIKTINYDDTQLSPNYTYLFIRPLRLAESQPAYVLGGVSEFGYDSSFDTDTTQVRSHTGGAFGSKSMPARTGWEGSIDLTTLEMISVEGQEILRATHETGEIVEIWAVQADVLADGATIMDAQGNVVKSGWMRDTYFQGRVDELSYESNTGDANVTNEYTINLTALPDRSWVKGLNIDAGGYSKLINRSLDKYNPENDESARYKDADGFVHVDGVDQQFGNDMLAKKRDDEQNKGNSTDSGSGSDPSRPLPKEPDGKSEDTGKK